LDRVISTPPGDRLFVQEPPPIKLHTHFLLEIGLQPIATKRAKLPGFVVPQNLKTSKLTSGLQHAPGTENLVNAYRPNGSVPGFLRRRSGMCQECGYKICRKSQTQEMNSVRNKSLPEFAGTFKFSKNIGPSETATELFRDPPDNLRERLRRNADFRCM
jgi:hypothetical protein